MKMEMKKKLYKIRNIRQTRCQNDKVLSFSFGGFYFFHTADVYYSQCVIIILAIPEYEIHG